MTPSGTFKLHTVFKLHQRGLVLTGNLLDGTIKSSDYLKMPDNSEPSFLKIISVEYVDHLQNHQAEIGLIIKPEKDFSIKDIDAFTGMNLLVMNVGDS